jgi:hypothetical protein
LCIVVAAMLQPPQVKAVSGSGKKKVADCLVSSLL